ncbi:hypothetical protein MUU74_08180 [Chryseobacterium daecheongense]|uniref:hypothetical protein n=1 Tax=Chryseobacterium daecheongense TaxID=192389 RepID=UPI001FD65AFA|nr:hypothetical protein [Chryseobacterium daecheongense]UOU99919.1 hypothetical protein MUU74_08180 [Chryseobacterium daecheongense]
MENKDFDFIDFINNKGFNRSDDRTFIYKVSNEEEVSLYIDKGEYIIPIALDLRFRKEIPKNENQAKKEFKTIEEILEITFEK